MQGPLFPTAQGIPPTSSSSSCCLDTLDVAAYGSNRHRPFALLQLSVSFLMDFDGAEGASGMPLRDPFRPLLVRFLGRSVLLRK